MAADKNSPKTPKTKKTKEKAISTQDAIQASIAKLESIQAAMVSSSEDPADIKTAELLLKSQIEFLQTIKPLLPFLKKASDDINKELKKIARERPDWQAPSDMYIWNLIVERAKVLQRRTGSISSFRAEEIVFPNDPLTNKMQQRPAINTGAFDLIVENRHGKSPERTAYAMVTFEEDGTELRFQGGRLDEYSRLVLSALTTLWSIAKERGSLPIFTVNTIFRAMPGGSEKPTPQQCTAIREAIEKLIRLRVQIDLTEEAARRGIDLRDKPHLRRQNIITLTEGPYITKNGMEITNAYKIEAEPFPLFYSNLTGQLLTVDVKYLRIQKIDDSGQAKNELLAMSPERQAMVGYMLRRILVMKHDECSKAPKQNHTILFDTLFDMTGTASENRVTTSRNRDFCFSVMAYWKAVGLITNYSKKTKGRKITGILINL